MVTKTYAPLVELHFCNKLLASAQFFLKSPPIGPQSVGKATPRKKRRRLLLLVSAAIIVVLAVVFVFYETGFFSENSNGSSINSSPSGTSPGGTPVSTFAFTVFNEHLFTYLHTHAGDLTTRETTVSWNAMGTYNVGRQVELVIPYHNSGAGNVTIIAINCSTAGFSIVKVSPELPVRLPNTVSTAVGNVTLTMVFSSPSSDYTGPFDFTVYFEQFD
jgi:hypothetical protein